MRLTTKSQIETVAEQAMMGIEFSPFGPTEVLSDTRLIVHAPFYPFMGRRALHKTIEVIRAHEQDKADSWHARQTKEERN